MVKNEILRCPFCNINDINYIDEDHEEEWKEGYRYYCAFCDKYYFDPVIDLSDVIMNLEAIKTYPLNAQGVRLGKFIEDLRSSQSK